MASRLQDLLDIAMIATLLVAPVIGLIAIAIVAAMSEDYLPLAICMPVAGVIAVSWAYSFIANKATGAEPTPV